MINDIMKLADVYAAEIMRGLGHRTTTIDAKFRAALLAEVERVSKDAARWHQLATYLISPSTAFDDAIVAAATVSEIAEVMDLMKEPS